MVQLSRPFRKVLAEGTKTFPNRFVGTEPFTIDIPIDQKEDVRRINFFYTYGTVEDFYRREFEATP